MRVLKESVEFKSDEVILRGWLFKPEGNNVCYPAIVMTPGYNCLKEFYLDNYANYFVQAGYAVLLYDNRNCGESDGLPRQELDPWQQIKDYRNAVTFLQLRKDIDPERIGIWGTSYSGGHVLVVAALDKRVKCVVSQVPTISGWNGMLRRVFPAKWDTLRKAFNEDRLNRFLGQSPKMIPVVTNPDSPGEASHASIDAWEFFTGKHAPESEKWRFKNWQNEVTLRSVEMYSEYEPGFFIERIAPTPLLMIVAKNDTTAVTDEALAAFNRAREIKKLHLFDGGHFAVYTQEWKNSATEALAWYQKYL